MNPDIPIARSGISLRQAFLKQETLGEAALRAPVRRSWQRAMDAGVRPDDEILFGNWISASEVRRIAEQHHSIIDAARPEMERLWDAMRSRDWMVLLTDHRGTVIHSVLCEQSAPRELRPLQRGRRLLETEIGTNAPALAAYERQPIVLSGEEHYLAEFGRHFCAAAPIMGPDGTLAAVLDVSRIGPTDRRAMYRVCAASAAIEARLYEQGATDFIVSLHEDARLLGMPGQGLLLVDQDGRITAANAPAQEMLSLDVSPPGSGVRLQDVLSERHLVSRGGATPRQVRTVSGMGLHLQVRQAARARSIVASKPALPVMATDAVLNTSLQKADRVFPHGLPVLLHGESGTGKEWVARRLHERHRPGKPFIAINCAALAEGLVESELFGHVDGAFTGSRKGGSAGLIEQAHEGTLFLDEIGDMPLHLQTRLLRVLQERRVTRVGGRDEFHLDVLIASATHRDLEELVAARTFREDLYFRLNGLRIVVPPLRERDDLPELIDQVLTEIAPDGVPAHLPDALRARLQERAWPGNIRQLRNTLQVASLLAGPGGTITDETLGEEPASITSDNVGHDGGTLDDRLRASMKRCLAANGGNVSAAARELGVSRTTLYKHLRLKADGTAA